MSVTIALAGNPNCGKTTMFNALTGANQYVGNWPGVTVEKKEGKLKNQKDVTVTDLPGIYSLSPYTLEEVVSRDYLLKEKPDVIIDLVDATNIERNLYLATQLLEIGIPVVIALNMVDLLKKNNIHINVKGLSSALGCPIVETSALKGTGLKEVVDEAIKCANQHRVPSKQMEFPKAVEKAVNEIESLVPANISEENKRWYAVKLLERDSKVKEGLNLPASAQSKIEEIASNLEKAEDDDTESIVTDGRYQYIQKVVSANVKRSGNKMTVSDKIDRIVTNRILALPIFAGIMFLIYWISVTTIGGIVTDFTNDTLFGEWICGNLGPALESIGCADWLVGLINDGIVGGVGAVLGFVPQMLVLFFMLSILEQIGYMARVAFILDRIFRRFGLSGKSFIPMLIGSGCGVPGVMASRTIENERDRHMTIMTTCFIPCGAKMPIIGLFAGALFGGSGLVAVSAYFIGVAAIVISGIMLKKTKPFAGEVAPFVMELPAYHIPTAGSVLRATWERGWSFIKRAGTVIVASSVVLWFLQGFGFVDGAFGMVEDNNSSLLATIGGAICWIFAPLGFGDWQSTVATITGLIAKENVVSTFGVLFGGFSEVAENGDEVWGQVALHYTQLTAYSFMVFNLLCAPCFAAMGAIKREMNNQKWFWAAIGYMCGLAYIVSMMIYQFGSLFTGNVHPVGLIVAIIELVFIIYMLVRKNPYVDEATGMAKKSIA